MIAQADMNKTTRDLWKIMQIGGLAFSIPFEIAAGPFIGYFIGLYLRNRFGMHNYIIYLFLFMGFIAALINVIAIIEMMVRINKKNNYGREN